MNEWKTAKCLRKGLAHIRKDADCQDSLCVEETDWSLVAVLTDGVGSLRNSRVAAEAAVKALSASLTANPLTDKANPLTDKDSKKPVSPSALQSAPVGRDAQTHKVKEIIVRCVSKEIQAQAAARRLDIATMDCTLAFVILMKQSDKVVIGVLGDGAVCVIRRDGKSEALTCRNDSANGTYTIMDKAAVARMELRILKLSAENLCGFILTSDGLENELYTKGSNHVNQVAEKYFNVLCRPESANDALGKMVDSLVRSSHGAYDDDIGLIVMSRISSPLTFPPDPRWPCSCGYRNLLRDTYCRRCGKDFMDLYQNIQFAAFGGKDAFFQRVNSEDKEKIPLRLHEDKSGKARFSVEPFPKGQPSGEPFPESSNHDFNWPDFGPEESGNVKEDNPRPMETGRRRDYAGNGGRTVNRERSRRQRTSWIMSIFWPALCALMLAVIVLLLFRENAAMRKLDELTRNLDDLNGQITAMMEESSPTNAVTEYSGSSTPFLQLSDNLYFMGLGNGRYYLGNVQRGLCSGMSMLLENGTYYIGNFSDGLREGKFAVVQQGEPPVMWEMEFSRDQPLTDQPTGQLLPD